VRITRTLPVAAGEILVGVFHLKPKCHYNVQELREDLKSMAQETEHLKRHPDPTSGSVLAQEAVLSQIMIHREE
jgi:hypothetical protein